MYCELSLEGPGTYFCEIIVRQHWPGSLARELSLCRLSQHSRCRRWSRRRVQGRCEGHVHSSSKRAAERALRLSRVFSVRGQASKATWDHRLLHRLRFWVCGVDLRRGEGGGSMAASEGGDLGRDRTPPTSPLPLWREAPRCHGGGKRSKGLTTLRPFLVIGVKLTTA